jgi:tetratricopeptide (TPR) repeat protein
VEERRESNAAPDDDVDTGGSMSTQARPRETVVLEKDVPLSKSLLWSRQRDYYVQRGLKAWTDDNVPAFITNNPFIAEIYAGIVAGFFDDCAALESLSPACPLRVLELGAGTGKFSYLFLRHLSALLRERGIDPLSVRSCMTDCSESLAAEWRGNPQLAEFVRAGMLEFAILEAGEKMEPPFAGGDTKGPLVVIANYVFDSLPQDAFVVQDRRLLEALLTTQGSAGGETRLPKDLELSYNNVGAASDRYRDPSWNDILRGYRDRLPGATVLFPSAALGLLDRLAGFSNGRLLLLAADKGHVQESDLALAPGPPALEWHAAGNCFSTMVNFDAIGKYFTGGGGDALLPEKHSGSLKVCAFLQRRPGDSFPATGKACRGAQEAFGLDDLFALLAWLNVHMEEMLLPQILAVLRLTRWDPTAFMRIFPVLAGQARNAAAERHDLRHAALRTWANHYPVTAGENVLAFQCGVILLELRFYAEAHEMFKTAQRVLGPSAATSYNLGLCAQGLERPAEALAFMEEACELDPQFEPARISREKLQQKVRESQG